MAIKIWDAKEGKIISLLYKDKKNKKILHLKEPVTIDNIGMIGEIDGAMAVLARYVARISNA